MEDNDENLRKKFIGKCLVAFDLDDTILSLDSKGDIKDLLDTLYIPLKKASDYRFNMAAVTGNTITKVINNFFIPLLNLISQQSESKLDILKQLYIFANGGGVLINFNSKNLKNIEKKLREIQESYKQLDDEQKENQRHLFADNKYKLLKKEFIINKKSEKEFVAKFYDENYLELTRVNPNDIEYIEKILHKHGNEFWRNYCVNGDLKKIYDLEKYEKKMKDEGKNQPFVEIRFINFQNQKICTQITLKPILSNRFLKKNYTNKMDPRRDLLYRIQQEIDNDFNIIDEYNVTSGGTSSIDITLAHIDKKYAIEHLIKTLKLQGGGEKLFGSNCIYFGDEVAIGGNDIVVADIEGVLVFAVNPDKDKVPCKSNIIVHHDYEGPEATEKWLDKLNEAASLFLNRIKKEEILKQYIAQRRTVIDDFKETFFRDRIREIIDKDKYFINERVSGKNVYQTLYLIITTLLNREKNMLESIIREQVNELFRIIETIKNAPNKADELSKPLGFTCN